jgi:hypothetical protein
MHALYRRAAGLTKRLALGFKVHAADAIRHYLYPEQPGRSDLASGEVRIVPLRAGYPPSVVFVRGFLSESHRGPDRWLGANGLAMPGHAAFAAEWKASNLDAVVDSARRLASDWSGMPRSGHAIPKYASVLLRLALNPWHSAQVEARRAGRSLMAALARAGCTDTVLVGHSLGASVVYHALAADGDPNRASGGHNVAIRDAWLLGGAIGRSRPESWARAASRVSGHIHNCYSGNDEVLRRLYRPACLFLSNPIGLGPIEGAGDAIVNHDVSRIVNGHMDYVTNVGRILAVTDA